MKLIFNDATELQIQQVIPEGDYLGIRVLESVANAEKLRELFSDPEKTRKMIIKEREEVLGTYEGFTQFYRTEEYTGKILGVTNYKPEKTPEAQEEVLISAVRVAQIQAQGLTDEEALTVQNLYPEWSGAGVTYTADYKANYNGVLYKCLQEHTSQEDWTPEVAASLWAKVLIPDPTVIPEWEQPGAENPYMKGDKVAHDGYVWVSLVDNNVWEPGAAGTETLWEKVEVTE